MRNQQVPLADIMAHSVAGGDSTAAYDIKRVALDMPFGVSAGAVLYIAAVRLVASLAERAATPRRL